MDCHCLGTYMRTSTSSLRCMILIAIQNWALYVSSSGNCDSTTGECRDTGPDGSTCSRNALQKKNMPTSRIDGQSLNLSRAWKSGWQGRNCQVECDDGKWGPDCNRDCGNCFNSTACDRVTGECEQCEIGYILKGLFLNFLTTLLVCKLIFVILLLTRCDESCAADQWGENCVNECFCRDEVACDWETGICPGNRDSHSITFLAFKPCETPLKDDLCAPGFDGPTCNTTCDEGFWGPNCNGTCGTCENEATCDRESGQCSA